MPSLTKNSLYYALKFALLISALKLILLFVSSTPLDTIYYQALTYFALSFLVALPLYIYKAEWTSKTQQHQKEMQAITLTIMGLIVLGGLLHDQIAVRLSPAYYDIGHFPINGVENKTLLALIWGFLGTWWFGAIIGIILSYVCFSGSRPVYPYKQLLVPILKVLITIECMSWFMAGVGYYLTKQTIITLNGSGYEHLVLKQEHPAFMADWFANGTAYLLISIATIYLIQHIIKNREKEISTPSE